MAPGFPALTAQQYLGHTVFAEILAMKANLKLEDFSSKTGRYYPGHDKP
jgi:hypothetical protein